MFRPLIFLSALPIAAAFVARWWFGMRVLSTVGRRPCSCDLSRWENAFGTENLPATGNADAHTFATFLRKAALADWKSRNPKAAASREGARRFGMAVPPLSLMVAIFAVGKIQFSGVIAVFLIAIALSVLISFLSISPELNAILITARRLRDTRIFHRRDDEDAVIQAASALVWKEAAPPVFSLIQK